MSVRFDLMTWGAKCRHLPVALFTVAAVAAMFVAICPARAFAEDVVAYSVDANGVRTEYTSISDAINAGCSDVHPTICMEKDWDLARVLEIPAGKKITIDMRGHTISFDHDKYSTNDSNLEVCKGAELTLTSSVTKEITYQGFDNTSDAVKLIDVTTTTGGLVTQKGSSKVDCWWGGIVLNRLCKLNLDGITVGGNRGRNGAGVQMVENDTLNMTNGASIEYNLGDYGGGIGTIDKNNTIKIDHSFVRKNEAVYYGGGSYLMKAGVRIDMTGGSEISDNRADAGGGVYFTYTDFELTSSDKTGVISKNYADESSTVAAKSHQSGGGIHVDQSQLESNKGLIENITIKDNHSNYDGGGIELDQENTVVRNCTITGNWSAYEGGGIYVCNDGNTIENCTITGNWCNSAGKTYEGGGVFVWNSYDVELKGLCTITGNTRGKDTGDPDDVFLREGTLTDAYIKGSLSKGSKVGVRTGVTSKDRMIAKSFSCPTNDCFFIDLDGYYVSYGSDHDGDAWQRKAEMEFAVTVNGEGTNRYKCGEPVTVNGTSADASRVFKCWDADGSTGLYPFADHVKDATDPALSFSMPQNDVNLVAEYVTRATAVTLTVATPVPGQELAATGTLSWTGADGEAHSKDGVAISWMEAEDGSYAPVSGEADYNGKYAVSAAVAQDLDGDLAFALDMDERDVTVTFTGASSGTSAQAQGASVDAAGTLNLLSATVGTAGRKASSVERAELTVAEGTSADALRALLPQTAAVTTEDGRTVTLDTKPSETALAALLDDSGNVRMPDGGKASVYVPLKGTADIEVPQDKVLEVEVTVTARQDVAVEAPTVDRDEGTYGEAISVTPSCATEGAAIMYSLSHSDREGSTSQDKANERYEGTSGIALPANEGGRRTYRLKLWATLTKDGVTFESARRTYTYVIDDTEPEPEPARTVTVTVVGTDTGREPERVTLAEYEVEAGSDLSIAAPSRGKGYAFEKWDGADGPTISLSDVTEDTTVTAVYNPVVTALDVHLSLPEGDKELAGTAAKVEAEIAGSKDFADISGYFEQKGDGVRIEWSPSDEKAAHATSYTATMSVSSLDSGVKYILAPDATVLVNGNDVAGGAYVVERDGRSSVCVRCPVTGPAEYESVAPLGTVELTYREALTAKASQAAGDGLSGWNLPSTVKVRYECGESWDYEIAWGDISALDESATGVQELTATGTISFADRSSYVSHDGDTETVTVKVRVAAKEAVKVPTASVKPGTYKAAQKVELECETEGAAIRYTTDGSDPTEGSPAYDGTAIEVSKTTEIRARAYADGMAPSDVASFAYTIEPDDGGKKDDGSDKKDDSDDDSGKDDSGKKDDGSDKKDDGKSDAGADDKGGSDKDASGKGNGGAADGGNGNGSASGSNTTAATAATTEKPAAAKPLPRTGDYTLITVAALLVAGLVIVAAGIFVSRRKK